MELQPKPHLSRFSVVPRGNARMGRTQVMLQDAISMMSSPLCGWGGRKLELAGSRGSFGREDCAGNKG